MQGITVHATRARQWMRAAPVRAAVVLALALPAVTGAAAVQAAHLARPDGPAGLNAGPQNGSFEAGLANWSITGHVEALTDTDITSTPPTTVTPPAGGRYAMLCNGPGLIDATELNNLDLDPGPNNDNDRSTLTQTFTLLPNEVPATLSFDWSFLTSEAPTPGNFDDFFRVFMSGPGGGLLLAGSSPTSGVSPFPDVTPLDGVVYHVSSVGSTSGCHFQDGRSPFKKFIASITTPGTYVLEFLVSDQGNNDHAIDTGLLVDNVQLTPEVDLAVTKTASPDPAIAGEGLTYDMTVHNYGTGIARNVVLTDVLPPQVVYVADTNVPACIQSPTGTLTCQLGDMPGGDVKTFQIRTTVKADQRALGTLTLSNFAHVECDSPDKDPTNNDFTLRTVLLDRADLKVTKLSVPNLSIQAGQTFAYTVYVDNLGPSYARNVTLLDDILASGQFTLVSIANDPNRPLDSCTSTPGVGTPMPGTATPPPGTGTPTPAGKITCTLGEALEPQGFGPGNGRWTIEVRVKALNAVDVQNMVRVFSGDPDNTGPDSVTFDPDLSNNSAIHFIAVTSVANLRITKIGADLADGDLTVIAGGAVKYTITVNNDGPSTAQNVTVVDQLPGGLVEGSLQANITVSTGAGGICTVGTPGDPADPAVCQVGTLPAGANAVITIIGDVDPSFVANQPVTQFADYLANDAFVFSDTFDNDTLHNRANDSFIQVVGSADLAVVKTDLPDPVQAGMPLRYDITVTNNGPSTAQSPIIDDNLPAGVTFLSASVLGGKGSCVYDPGANRVRCTLDNMAPKEVTEIQIVVNVNPNVADATVLSNTALRNATLNVTPDPNGANDQSSTTTTVIADSDVAVVKSVDPVKVGAGEEVKYTVNVRNNGPSDAHNVVVYDVLPNEVTYEVDTANPACTRPTNLVGFRALLSGASVVPPVLTQAAGLATFVLNTATNELTYSIQPTDISGGDITAAHINLGAAGVNGAVHANLYSGTPPTFTPAAPLVGKILLTALETTDLLANAHYVSVDTVGFPTGLIRGQLVRTVNSPLRCEVGTLPPAENRDTDDIMPWIRQFDIWALVSPSAPPGITIHNIAIVTSDSERVRAVPPPPVVSPAGYGVYLNGFNNVWDAKNYIESKADLKIVKFGRHDGAVRAGEILTYTVMVDNLGPGSAQSPAVKDLLQSSGRFDLIDITSDRRASCSALPAFTPGNPQLLLPTPWPPTTAPPPFGVLLPTGIANINQRLQVDCTMVDDPATPVNPSDPPVNEGALNVLKADGPPNTGRWILTMRVRAAEPQDVKNVADVTSVTKDPNFANNHAEVQTDITAVADLSVTKTALGENTATGCPPLTNNVADKVTAGKKLTYTIVVRNGGPSTALNTQVFDRLPPGLVVTSVTVTGGGGGSCESGTAGSPLDRLTCGLDSIIPGGTRTITVVATVNPSLPNGTVLENDAFVTSDVFDINNRNNFATNFTTVNTAADLSITKTDSPDPVVAGKPLQYTITVTNPGPSDAQDVQVVDTLPSAVTFASASGAACRQDAIQTQLITCQLGTIPAGRSVIFFIVVNVNPNADPSGQGAGSLTNTATVSSSTFDPCLTNNTVTQTTTVNRVDDVFITKSGSPDPVLAGNEETYLITFGNNGPSTSTNVSVLDTLPKGVKWDRCEALDPNDSVACTVLSGDGNLTSQVVRLDTIKKANVVVWSATTGTATNDLDPGETYSFKLIAVVASGYVLDGRGDTGVGQTCAAYLAATGWPHFAADRAQITSLTDGAIAGNNFDDVCTRVNAEADLAITSFADGALPPPPIFMMAGAPGGTSTAADLGAPDLRLAQAVTHCDFVTRGGIVTYTLTVTNLGPSDAAQVWVVDQLPPLGIVLDPTDVSVTVSRGQVVTIRDDGFLEIIAGNDPNNLGANQLGRLNANSTPVVITIVVHVSNDAICGSVLTNTARVETRRNDVIWPLQPGAKIARTPTLDPNLTNNFTSASITVACPSIQIKKTVSFDGTCPGRPVTEINQTGQPVTFCFEITNTGDTHLDNVHVIDILTTRTAGSTVIFDQIIKDGKGGNVPLAPGETVNRQVTIPQLLKNWDCGRVTDTVTVSAEPTNSGRTRLLCLPVVTGSDTAVIEVPCAGVDFRLQLPVIDNQTCQTWIQVQNVGDHDTKALAVFWGDPGACEPQAAGPLKVECSGLLRPGSAWSFALTQIPRGARSAMVYSMNATATVLDLDGNKRPFADVACGALFTNIVGDWERWQSFDLAYRLRDVWRGPYDQSGLHQVVLDFSKNYGEPLAVTVNRKCPDVADPNVKDNAAYTGISSDEEGARDPASGSYTFYAPLMFAQRNGLNSVLNIQNSGIQCSSLEIWFKAQDNCLRAVLGDVLNVAGGETVKFDPNTVVGPDWIGSAWIRSTQPLGIVVDSMAANHFTAYNGVPGDVSALDFSYGDQVTFAPLIYNQMQGWDTNIQVQNHSAVTNAKVKVYFLDQGGDIIATVVDWICPRGSQSFFLPVIGGLPGNWVGSARVESQVWWTPGSPQVDAPYVSAVVMLEKWADPARSARREAVAYNAQTECLLYDWQIGANRGGLQSGSAVFAIPLLMKDYQGITTELGITNLVPKPGFTDFAIFIYDQNGLLDQVCEKLTEKQVEYIDLATWGYVNPHFNGSAVVSATFWEHDVFDNFGKFQRNVVGLGGVAVERVGGVNGGPDVPGDESKAFESFPVYDNFRIEDKPLCPGSPSQ